MSRIVCTGGAGYIGSVLVPKLLEEGHRVTVVDTFVHGVNSLAACCDSPHFEILNEDCRDMRVMKPLIERADVIIPLAALVGAPACERDRWAAHSLNYAGFSDMMYCVDKDQRVIYPNTNSGYGTTPPDVFCDETTPLKPLSTYGVTKKAGEDIVMERESSITFRLATVFGVSPRHRWDLMVNEFVLRAVKDKFISLFGAAARRNFVHILDVVDAFEMAIEGHLAPGVYNCGNKVLNMTKTDLCRKIGSHVEGFTWQINDTRDDPDKRDYMVSNDKIEAAGFRFQRDLDEGIPELIKAAQMIGRSQWGNV